jgi:hypothetical protein
MASRKLNVKISAVSAAKNISGVNVAKAIANRRKYQYNGKSENNESAAWLMARSDHQLK